MRVNISGQFNTLSICSSTYSKQAVKVDRQSLTYAPEKWSDFCNAVDNELRMYESVRTQFKYLGFVSLVFIFATATIVIYPSIIDLIGIGHYEFTSFTGYLMIMLIIIQIANICITNQKVEVIWNKVEKICHTKSGNSVSYKLFVLPFDGCRCKNQQIPIRYFINVEVQDVEELHVESKIVLTSIPNAVAVDPGLKNSSVYQPISLRNGGGGIWHFVQSNQDK